MEKAKYTTAQGLEVERLLSIAYRVTKDEALDLPEQTFENRVVPMMMVGNPSRSGR